jgi:hypothetical protein
MGSHEDGCGNLSTAHYHARPEGEMADRCIEEVLIMLQTQPHAIADLVEAAILQEEFAQQRWALEWGELVFAQLTRVWNHLETHESLAYEDKVTAQIRLLDEAISTLRCLQKPLVPTRRLLKQHRQHLRHQKALHLSKRRLHARPYSPEEGYR